MSFLSHNRPVTAHELEELLRQARTGHKESTERLFAFLRSRLLGLARYRVSELAEDMVHETIIIVHKHFTESETLEGLIAFANQVLRNKIGNLYQRRYRKGHVQLEDDETGYTIDRELEGRELEQILQVSIERLSARHPDCGEILSCLYNGFEPDEISVKMGIPKSRLKVRTFRCRAALRQLIFADYGLEW